MKQNDTSEASKTLRKYLLKSIELMDDNEMQIMQKAIGSVKSIAEVENQQEDEELQKEKYPEQQDFQNDIVEEGNLGTFYFR